MAVLFTKAHALKELPKIKDKNLYNAVDLALWMYLDKCFSLKNAINSSAKKYSITPKSSIEKIMRQVIPEEVFLSRVSAFSYKGKQKTKTVRKDQKIAKMEKEAKLHISEIAQKE